MIYLGADHRGYELKENLKLYLKELGLEYRDMGAFEYDKNDDFVIFASAVAEKIALAPKYDRGLVICGSGVGVDVVANKFDNVRSALGFNASEVSSSRNDDNANVLALPADYISEETAKEMVKVFLETKFAEEERFVKRIEGIKEIEKTN